MLKQTYLMGGSPVTHLTFEKLCSKPVTEIGSFKIKKKNRLGAVSHVATNVTQSNIKFQF